MILRWLSPYFQCLRALKRKDREIQRLQGEVRRLMDERERLRREANERGVVLW